MATTGKEGIATESPWISVTPGGLWEVQRRWTEPRKQGDHTPLMGSVCKIRICLKSHREIITQSQNPNEPELAVSADSEEQVTQHPRSQQSVLQVPLDRWILLRMGDGQCDIMESCLEGMRAGETCEVTVRACQKDSRQVPSDGRGTQSDWTGGEGKSLPPLCFFLQLHSFSPGQETWLMTPANKWAWVQSHKKRGTERFRKGDIWGAAHSYCCAVKLVITLKGQTRGDEVDRGDQDGADLTSQHVKGEEAGEKEAKGTQGSHIPTEEEYRTMKVELHSNLSLCQLRLGQPIKARDSSSKATELDPVNVKAWYRHGQACLQLKDFEEARQSFGKVLELQPDSASALNALKQVNAKAKEFDSKLGHRLSKMFS
ncbi:FK506-binding protein-like [Electrophorus electricus]|uniref:FK506-binding protein-like n=1 Tax=Electrophorus electricus TaxID=8005 RepID=A0A4W4GIX1_ELEEL|nr:FK506-binding protein-like [Electrophorus electricus]